jgi:flavin-dependent dehydrogenase
LQALVLGSGPAAYAAALAILANGGTVTLLRRVRAGSEQIYGEHLAPGAKAQLALLGLNSILTESRHRASHGITSVWGTSVPHIRDYLFNPYGCGWNLDRATFDRALADQAMLRGLHLLEATHIEAVNRTDEGWEIVVATPAGRAAVTGRFVIDATGRAAAFARRLGLRCDRRDRLVGLYARLEHVACEDANLLLEAAPDGWWYTVPLSGDALVAVFMTDSDLLPAGGTTRSGYWLAQLNACEATRARIGNLREVATLHVAPASSQCLSVHAGPNWLAVGDASMAFDPLSAAGIAKALEDGLNAARHVERAFGQGGWSPDAYTDMQNTAFRGYLDTRWRYYRMEQRWPRSLFWQRRHRLVDVAQAASG